MKHLSAESMAIRDMTDEFRSIPTSKKYNSVLNEVWFVSPSRLANKVNRKLNRALGLHKVNKQRL